MFLQSIRFKIVLWYLLILSLTLLLFSVSVYQNFKSNLYGDLDELLESKASGIASAINTYWEAQKLEAQDGGNKVVVFDKADNINFAKIAQRWVKEKRDAKSDIIVQVYDINGKKIASSENIPEALVLSSEIFDDVSEGEEYYDNIEAKLVNGKVLHLRAYTMPVLENDKVSYIVQVASPVGNIYEALDSLKVPFFVYLPLTVVLAAFGGLLLVNLAFNPVNSMIKTIRQITAENLKLRVRIPDGKDEIKNLAETFNDMLAKLEGSFLAERKFIQDVSHELRTPLTILKGEFEVALKKARSPEEYESVLESSLEEVDRINKIVDDLLTLARLENKDIPLRIQRLDLNLLVGKILDDMSVLAEQKNIRTELVSSKEIFLDADERHLRRLFSSLLDNAFKYTPEGGKVTLRVSKNNDSAVVEIVDTGIGIPEADLPHIFDRFYRTQKSHSSVGFGLGLAIAHSIVAMHKGKIEIKSRPGQGTTFIVSLPLAFR